MECFPNWYIIYLCVLAGAIIVAALCNIVMIGGVVWFLVRTYYKTKKYKELKARPDKSAYTPIGDHHKSPNTVSNVYISDVNTLPPTYD